MATEEEMRQAQQQMIIAQHNEAVKGITKVGHAVYGKKSFDDAANVVGAKLADRTYEFVEIAKEFDDPAGPVMTLANNPTQLEQMSKLPTARMVTEIARIESRSKPHGHATTGNQPAWQTVDHSGHVSYEEWQKTGGSQFGNDQDEAWNRAFDKVQAERSRKVPR